LRSRILAGSASGWDSLDNIECLETVKLFEMVFVATWSVAEVEQRARSVDTTRESLIFIGSTDLASMVQQTTAQSSPPRMPY